MHEPLATYLADHLAGSIIALEVLQNIGERYAGDPVGRLAEDLWAEVNEDRVVVKDLAEEVGDGTNHMKEVAAWVTEKVSRWKLGHPSGGLGTLEGLEFVGLGIQGKQALWRALAVAAPQDARLQHLDYDRLLARAQSQHDRVENARLAAARLALRPDTHSARRTIRNSETGDGHLGRIALWTLGLAAVYVAVTNAPDLARYLRIARM
jgi:hypothetical protein